MKQVRRILVVMPFDLEVVNDGSKLRAEALVRGLRENFEVVTLSFESKYAPPASAFSRLNRFFSIFPALIRRFKSSSFGQRVAELSRDADLCFLVGLQMAQYRTCLQAGVPVVLDNYNVESDILFTLAWRRPWKTRWFWLLEALKLRLFEAWALRQMDLCIAISDEDAQGFRRLAPGVRTEVIPPALDLEPYREIESTPIEGRLVFTGALDWHVNEDAVRWMALKVMPRILEQHPRALLQIVGRNPSPKVWELAGAAVEVHANVPSVLPYLKEAQVVVAPLQYGSGVQFKVCQAMAAGKPVVVTPIAATGIRAERGRHFALGATASEFALECCRLLSDPGAAQEMGNRARVVALEAYSDKKLGPKLVDLVERLSGRNGIQKELSSTD